MPTENGYVPTPPIVADYAASVAFGAERPDEPSGGGRMLLPGLGTGNLYDAVKRYCTSGEGWSPNYNWEFGLPECVGVENDPKRVQEFRDEHGTDEPIDVLEADFLTDPPEGPFDWVLANPPYLRYKDIDPESRDVYRRLFRTTTGQFDLCMPFFEQSMRLLKDDGWLTFILPTSALTTDSFEPLRWEIRSRFVAPIMYLPGVTFDEKVETFVISVQKRKSDFTPLWIESFYGYEVRDILEGLDIDDVDEGIEEYYDEYDKIKRFIYNRGRRERESATDAGRQQGLDEWGVRV